MSTATATVTAKIGPGLTATAIPLVNVTNIAFQVDRNVLSVTHGAARPRITDFDFTTILTVTWTISGANGISTVTIST